MIRKAIILLILAGLVLAAPAGAYFETVPVSARSRAMGEAYSAVPDVAYAPFHNASWLADVPRGEVAFSYVRPFGYSFSDFYTAGAAFPLESRFGNLGVGVSHFKVAVGDTTLLQETAVSLAHGFELFSDFHSRICFGWALNLYSVKAGQSVSGFDPGSDTAVGLDLGLSMLLHKRTRAGFQVRNLNNPTIGLDGQELTQRLVAGVAYEPYDGVITTFEFDNEIGRESQYHGGIEMTVVDGFALRAGVVTDPSRLTGGFGYRSGPVALDYGFSTGGGILDSTHQFGLRLSWGGEAPVTMTILLNRAKASGRLAAAVVFALSLSAGLLPGGGLAGAARAAPATVDLNSAPREAILALPIPAELAARIYERRVYERFYANVYELMEVDGMTPAILEQLKPLVSTLPPGDADAAMARLSASFRQTQDFLNEEGASEGLADEYLDRLRNPVDINGMDLYDLMSYQNVSPVDATAILKARRSLGRIEDDRQLRGVDGLRYFSYRGLRNFVAYDADQVSPNELSVYVQTRDAKTPYAGLGDDVSDFLPLYGEANSRPGWLNKIRLGHRDGVQGGLLTAREFGETDWNRTTKGFVGVSDRHIGGFRLKSLVMGDFRAAFGLGLVMDNTDYMKYRKTGYGFDTRLLGIHGDLSRSYEYDLRGAAAEASYGPVDLSAFVAGGDRDGILNPDGTVNRYLIMRPRPTDDWLEDRASGLTRDAFHETTVGGNLKVNVAPGTYLGVTGYEARYDRGFRADETVLVADTGLLEGRDSEIAGAYTSVFTDADGNVETHKFRRVLGAEAQTVFANVALQGEYAFMQDPRRSLFHKDHPDAYVINAFSQWNNLHLLAIYRDYDVGFDNPYSRAFSNDSRYEMTLLDSDFRLVDNHYAWLVSGTPQPKAERGLFIDMRYRFSRKLILSGLQFDQWTRKADGADLQRYTVKGEYQPIFNLRLKVRHRFSSRSEADPNDVRAYRNWETRWSADFLMSDYNKLTFTYVFANVMFPARPRLGGTDDPGAGDPSVGTAGMRAHAFEARYEHSLAPGLKLIVASMVYDGFVWNFEGNEFVLMNGKSFRNWLHIESRISERLLCQLKVTSDHDLPKDLDVRNFGDPFANDPDASRVPKNETTVRLQMDYTF